MTKLTEGVKEKNRKQQLRGDALEQRIETVIRELAVQTQKLGKEYVYNASHVAKLVPTTRKTLGKHQHVVERLLKDIKARRRMVTGDATVEQMREKIEYLKEQIAEKDKIVLSLRKHHIEIYHRFYAHSLDAEVLIRPILEQECKEAGECLFCGAKADTPEQFKRKTNIFPMKEGKKQNDK